MADLWYLEGPAVEKYLEDRIVAAEKARTFADEARNVDASRLARVRASTYQEVLNHVRTQK